MADTAPPPVVDEQTRLIEVAGRVLTQNYRQPPLVLERGQGCRVWDVAGVEYLDLTAGIAACPLGHAHPRLTEAIRAQAGRLLHVSNLFFNDAQIRLAERLCARAKALGSPRAFFCNSGAEANEAAIKLAKRYQTVVRGRPERMEVLSFEGSFHGRSIATVALTGQEKYRAGFGPLVEWARVVPFPDAPSDTRALDAIGEHSCAVIIEPIQAEGGIRQPPAGFFAKLRERCSATGTVLIFDEVQTGVGRTGTFFGYEQTGVVPDVLSLAKGLAGGVPIGCTLASDELARGFGPGNHASTFGGNPLATAAALAVLDALDGDRLLAQVVARGEHLRQALVGLIARHPKIAREVRGQGLLCGLELDRDAAPVVAAAREERVLLSVAGGTVVRFVPAFIVSEADLDRGVAALDRALSRVETQGA
jgi:predicted acetylornithine/succinylornithine family transaminase